MSETPVIFDYLKRMAAEKASDLYLTVGVPPTLRRENEFSTMSEINLTDEDIESILSEVLTSRQRREFESNMELNVAFDMGDEGRFRINILRQRQHNALVIRRITSEIPSFSDLSLPPVLEKLALSKRGLILVCGVTSSGKSTSLAAMADYRNMNQPGHIITIEDPVEYYHQHKKSIVTQREVGIDTASYNIALKNALRQKPDVILVGEIRDPEVMEQTISAAETGHLCLATLHTNNTSQAIERIINFFPEERQHQMRMALAMNLRAVVGQRLVKKKDGGLVPAVEILLNEAFIRELILNGQTQKIREVLVKNKPVDMQTFDQSLFDMYQDGVIDAETAIMEADIPGDMRVRIKKGLFGSGGDESGSGPLSQIDRPKLTL